MKISILVFGQIRQITGTHEIRLDVPSGITVEKLLHLLGKKHDSRLNTILFSNEKLSSYYSILINGKSCHASELKTKEVKEGDRISIVPYIAGG